MLRPVCLFLCGRVLPGERTATASKVRSEDLPVVTATYGRNPAYATNGFGHCRTALCVRGRCIVVLVNGSEGFKFTGGIHADGRSVHLGRNDIVGVYVYAVPRSVGCTATALADPLELRVGRADHAEHEPVVGTGEGGHTAHVGQVNRDLAILVRDKFGSTARIGNLDASDGPDVGAGLEFLFFGESLGYVCKDFHNAFGHIKTSLYRENNTPYEPVPPQEEGICASSACPVVVKSPQL